MSYSDEWSTPDDVFHLLDNEFHFDLDPCCTPYNAKCPIYFTKEDDGLSKSWLGNRVFCNPPYSHISDWVRKAYYESRCDHTLVVLLIPSRTDTKYFHNFILHRSEIRFLDHRLRFNNSKQNAPFPSMVVIFRGPYV